MKVQSYLSFEGRCDEALGFYKKALGAEVVPLMPTFFTSSFGMLNDRFGLGWLLVVNQPG